jgi:hypothetical protein
MKFFNENENCGIGNKKNENFSIAVNFKQNGDFILNNFLSSCNNGWSIGFLVRNVLENSNNFEFLIF